jgi:hypothetical protein
MPAAILLEGSLAFKADAQISRGAATICASAKLHADREGRLRALLGRWCGPFHRRVCRFGRC